MVLLQTILIVILVYYGLKFLLKWLAPKLLNYAVKKTNERFNGQFGDRQDFDTAQPKEGETIISKKPPRRSNSSKKVGEYIDFEEID
ncbi:DUF4834 family protein [Flagellimonas sp.]|uniref:DUF4834 family protein n=1 Tax=Flagellimonas sp. TaxID=2058762 RepID=UPI003BA84DFB